MDAQTVTNLVSSVGFPILCVIFLYSYMDKERKDHKDETDGLKAVIAEINETLAGLKQLIQDKLNKG